MENMIITKCPLRPTTRTLAVLTVGQRVTSMWGAGVLVHLTDDGWAGVRLDGESAVHEFPAVRVFRAVETGPALLEVAP